MDACFLQLFGSKLRVKIKKGYNKIVVKRWTKLLFINQYSLALGEVI